MLAQERRERVFLDLKESKIIRVLSSCPKYPISRTSLQVSGKPDSILIEETPASKTIDVTSQD